MEKTREETIEILAENLYDLYYYPVEHIAFKDVHISIREPWLRVAERSVKNTIEMSYDFLKTFIKADNYFTIKKIAEIKTDANMARDDIKCQNCKFFFIISPKAGTGKCKLYPPFTNDIGNPAVLMRDWCGQHKLETGE